MNKVDKMIKTEHAYIECFAKKEQLPTFNRYVDSLIIDMYSHNLTYITKEMNLSEFYETIKTEKKARTKQGFLNIQVDKIYDETEVFKNLGLSWKTLLSYYQFDLSKLNKLKTRKDCYIRKLDEKQLKVALAFDLYTNGDELGEQFTIDRFDRRSKVYLESDKVDCYLCYIDNLVVAHCDLFIHEGVAKIEDFDVMPDMQRQGIGTTVLNALVSIAVEKGASIVYLITDTEDTAKEMYEKCKMVHVATKQEYFFGFKDK